ncbi:MAG: PQQ-dependent sugar dehydrogenase [Bacteroidia bacterium]
MDFTFLLQWGMCQAQPVVLIEPFATGFTQPVDIAHAGDSRLFVVQRNGIIYILDSAGVRNPVPFLDIDARVQSTGGSERGLLGLVFHPQYPLVPHFYVNYINNEGNTRISRFTRTANPDIADPISEVILLTVDQPYSNHNGGDLAFGPDGYLYASLGDGGNGGDPQNHGQTTSTLLGNMLRIDVDSGSPYAIPADNPFVQNPDVADEIWAYGLRNPWRFSFDRLTGDIWIADVGQNQYEEINFQPATSSGGENYGWRCFEGNHNYNQTGCVNTGFTFPVFEYVHNSTNGCSVTGGFVYRGSRYPSLYGHYIFADYCSGRFWTIFPDSVSGWEISDQGKLAPNSTVGSFGENYKGEIFVAGTGNGIIYHLKETCPAFSPVVTVSGDSLIAEDGAQYQWYLNGAVIQGANSQVLIAADSGSYSVAVTDANGCTGLSDPVLVLATGLDPEKDLFFNNIYPNPGSGGFTVAVNTPSAGMVVLEVLDTAGRICYRGQTFFRAGENYWKVSISDIPSGVYLVQIRQNGRSSAIRWVNHP